MAIRADDVDLERDRDLVQRYQGGDPGAFDDLYQRYFNRLHGYCERRIGDRHTAEEIAQEAFVRALRAMPGFAGEQRFYPWMTVIARRLCIDHHRRNGRVEPTDDIDPGSVEPDHDFLFRAVEVNDLGVALERLAPRHREVLDLREWAGLSYAEIAAHLDVPVSTVEALLHRARKALRREYRAVAGHDRAWGLPVLAGLMARISGWRTVDSRAAEATAWAVPAAAAAVATVALGLPSLTAPPPMELETVVPTTAVAVTTAAIAEPAAPVVVDAPPPGPAAPRSPVAPVATTTTTTTEPGPLPEPDTQLGTVRVYTDDEKKAEVAEHTETMPIHGQVHEIYYGIDPLAPVKNLDGTVDSLLGGLP